MTRLFLTNKNRRLRTVGVMAICCCFLVWLGIALIFIPVASAAPLNNQPQSIASSNPIQDLGQKTKDTLDQTMGSGTSEQIEGQIEEATGTVQRKAGEITGQAEGAMKQVKGKAKQDLGKVKGTAEEAGSQLQETSEGVVEKVKDFFGQQGN